MRPALLRLLKRPSALSVIDSLVSSPSGIEHLESRLRNTCIACQSSSAQLRERQYINVWPPEQDEHLSPSTKPSNIRVREIRSPSSKTASADLNLSSSPRDNLPNRWKQLGLQPERLEYESDVGHTYDIGTRLVDDPIHRNDFSLWLELLRYRQRRYGDNGTLDIWEGLMTRLGGVHLPVDGENADFFWRSFVELGFKRETILSELASYAFELWNKTGRRWGRLYESIVCGLIERGMVSQAVKWHKRLQDPHLSSPNDIIQCLKSAISHGRKPVNAAAGSATERERGLASRLSAFREICNHTDGHRLYGQAIAALINEGEFTEALRMHSFLVKRDDHPRSYKDLRPLLQHAKKYGPAKTYEKLRHYSHSRFPRRQKENESADSDIHTTKPQPLKSDANDWFEEKQFKDDFGARVFATKALNFDMILSGLKMFGVPAIGPLSLREMATRARGSQDILNKLGQLEKEGISVGSSVFTRLLRRLATENREILLSDLLHSDQHPDMLEDLQTQESLLISYYSVRDWRQYNLTLAVLKELLGDGPELVNVHVRKHIAAGEWTLASNLVDEMLTQGGIPTDETISFMVRHVLSPRKLGAGPARQPTVHFTQEVASVFRLLQRIAQAGGDVSPVLWIEVIKRYGMTDCWNELRACCLWLARHYSSFPTRTTPPSSRQVLPATVSLSRAHGQQMLKSIFTPQMQDAIVAWGFIIQPPTRVKISRATGVEGEQFVPFARGIVLLRELKQKGIHLRSERMCRACRQRLVMLYGRPALSSRPKNRELRRQNPYAIDQVIADINRAWGEPTLFDDRQRSRLYRMLNAPAPRPRVSSRLLNSTGEIVQ